MYIMSMRQASIACDKQKEVQNNMWWLVRGVSQLGVPPWHDWLVRQVRKAVGLGRMALDPLALIATLCGRRKEVLSLKLHELQDKLPKEILAQRLEQVGAGLAITGQALPEFLPSCGECWQPIDVEAFVWRQPCRCLAARAWRHG